MIIQWYSLAIAITLALLGAALYLARKSVKWDAKLLASGAMFISAAFVLSYIRLYKLPQGGSVTLASMLPICAFAFCYGLVPGTVVGAAYGALQFIQEPYFVHPVQILVDYPMAFAALALAALARRIPLKYGALAAGVVIGAAGRLVMATLSGAVFFGQYAPEGTPALLYSFLYNFTYMSFDTAVCVVICLIPGVENTLRRVLRRR